MSLVPENATLVEHVATLFLSLRGDGVALSPNDAELLYDWDKRGVPYDVVVRGIRRSVQQQQRDARPGTTLRTLRSCRAEVEREFLRWQGLKAGAHAEAPAGATVEPDAAAAPEPAPRASEAQDFAAKRLKKAVALLVKSLESAPSPAHARAMQIAIQMLIARSATDPREVSRAVSRADDAIALSYVRGLPFEQRLGLVRAAREQAGPFPEGASPRGRKDALRTYLVTLARTRGALPSIV